MPAEEAPSRPRILVVDDDLRLVTLIGAILAPAGFECLTAHGSKEAWQRLTPDVSLVLLDLMMPGESGPAILRRMQMDPTLAKIPVIFMSGRADAATRIQCLAMGAHGFIIKPFEAEALLARVRAMVAPAKEERPADGEDDPLAAALGLDPGTSGSGSLDALLAGASESTRQIVQGLLGERQALKRRLDASNRLISALLRLHQMVNVGLPVDRVAQGIVELMHKVLGVTDAVVWIPRDGTLHAVGSLGVAPEPLDPEGPVAPARAWRDWLTVASPLDDTSEQEMHMPLTVGAEAVGVLSVRAPTATGPSPSLAAFFCAEAAIALDASIRLRNVQQEALTDALTGLGNRRYLDQRLAEEFHRATSLAKPLGVLFVDVDHFKQLNDRHGHQCGDRVLRTIAGSLRAALRRVDVVARYGGEEFVAVLPDTGADATRLVAERVRALVVQDCLREAREVESVSVTVGVAVAPRDASDPGTLVARADQAMLRGKRAGRNRVEEYAPSPAAAPVDAPPAPAGRGPAIIRPRAALRALLRELERKDAPTYRHSLAVGALSARLARHLGLTAAEVEAIGQAGLLHDIGKIHTPDEVLLKPGPLSNAERVVMKQHAGDGAELADAHPGTRHLTALVHASQEAFDGGGYPLALAGSAIPLGARIIGVTDAYHAMTSDRPYRAASAAVHAIRELRRCAGSQFDPLVVEKLVELLRLGAAAPRPRRRRRAVRRPTSPAAD